MAVSNATPKIQFTGNNSTTEFAFNFVVPASLTTGEITDSTASITQGTTTLTVSTSDLFYTSDLQGKAITIAGAGAGSSTLETTIVTVDSATQVTIANAASVTVSNAAIVVTTGKTGTTLKNNNEIEVFVDSTQQTINSDYTVRLNVGDDANKQGAVIFTSPPASSTIVSIVRNIELSRTSDFQAGGALTAKELNAQFDNVVMAVQDQKNDDDRFIQFPANEPASTSGVLPDATNRANKFFVFDSNGDIDVSNNINLPSADLSVSSITTTSGTITTLNTTTGTITNLTSNNVDIGGGSIDGTVIGATTPANGSFANLYSADVNFDGGAIDNVTIGANTAANGTFADLTVTGTLTNTGGNFILGSVVATGANGYTGQKLQGYQSNDLEISSNADVILTAGAGASHRVKLDDHVGFVDSNSSITVGARTHTGKILTSPNADMVLNPYNGASGGKLTVVSTDGIHIDGVNPKVKGLLQLELEDGDNRNNILLSNSADADTAGIQLTPHANSNVKLNQLNFPPVFAHHETGAIGEGKGLRLMYKKTVVFGLSGQQFTYPTANVGDKLVMSGANDNYGYVLFPVIGGTTSSSVTYIVLTPKQTWATSGPYLIADHLNQTTLFTSSSGTPSISSQNNDTGYHVGYLDQLDGQDTDDLTEGSSNLYYTDARVLTKINATSIDALSDVNTTASSPTDGQVLTWSASNNYFKPETPTTAPVTSVNSQTGAVSLSTDDVPEGSTNQYFTSSAFGTQFTQKTTDNLSEGVTNKYFTDERVDDRVGSLLTAGTGISLTYNDSANSLTITNTNVGIANVVDDTSPQLGGDLDVNGNSIITTSHADLKIQPNGNGATLFGADNTNAEISTNGTGDLLLRTNGSTTTAAANSGQIKINDGTDGDIEITPHGDGQIDLDSYVWPKNGLGGQGQYLQINSVAGGVAQLAWTGGTSSGLNDIVDDTTPQLGGDLDTQSNALSGDDIIPSTGSNGGFSSGGSAVRLLSSGVTNHDHAIRTAADSGRQNISFIMDSTGSFSAAQTSNEGVGSGLIYSPLNMQIRDRGESTKTRTTFDIGVPYRGGRGSTITDSSTNATGKLLDVDTTNRKVYLQNVSGTFGNNSTTGVVTGTVTAVNSIGTNAVELTYDTNFASTATQSDLAEVGYARFSARDVLNTRGMRTSEPELHIEAGRIAFESNGTKMLDITDSGNIVADISTGQTFSPFGGILSDPSNMVEIKGGRYASGLRVYDGSVGDGTVSGFQLDPFHFDKYLGSDQKKGGQFSIQLFGEGLPKESYGSFGETDALGVHQKFEIKDNSDYYIGTVDTVSGDATVTDNGGSLFSNASAGDWIRIEGAVSDSEGNAMSGNLNCTISSVASDNSTIEINVPSSANSGKTLSDIITGTARNATIIKNSSTAIRMSAGTTDARHTFTHKSQQDGTNVDGNDRVELAFEAKKIIFTAGTDSDNVNAIQAENSEVQINEGQNDVDFRVHSNSSDDVLKVDAGDDKLITNGGQGYDTNNNSYRPNGGVKVQKGLTVTGDSYLDILHTRRESTTSGNYSIEVANDYTSTAFSAGGTAGSFGMAAYSDNTGSLGYVYPAYIQGLIGDGGSVASGGGGPTNNGVQIRTFDTGGHGAQYLDTTSAAEFRASSTKFMDDKLKFDYASNTVSIDSADSSGAIAFKTNGTERMRINSGGDLIINTTAAINSAKITNKFSRVSHIGMVSENDGGNFSTEHIRFKNTGTTRGSIVVDQSSTTYNTSSDYRLKENVVYDWDATTRLKQLRPARFNFIEDETDTAIDGFIAHEVTSVVPNAVYGEKDAVEEDGAIKPQQIDTSKLVPLLVKTIQELEQRITDLENGQ